MSRSSLILLLLAVSVLEIQAADPVQFPVEIQGSRRASEGSLASFAAVLPDRPVRISVDGYSPRLPGANGGVLPVMWEGPTEFVWDFGDGTGRVMVRDRSSVAHEYADDGHYTVTVEAGDERGVFARASHQIEITNRDPRWVRIAGVEIDPDTQLVELTASAVDVPGDDMLEVRWDFGDGATTHGVNLWRVEHQYTVPGTYEASVTVVDGEGGEASSDREILVTGAGDAGNTRMDVDDGKQPDSVTSGFHASTSGAIRAQFNGEMRSTAGLHLMPIRDGVCRFVFSAWDNANLALAMAVIDLEGLPPTGGRYTIDEPFFTLVFEQNRAAYESSKNTALGRFAAGGIGGVAAGASGDRSVDGDASDAPRAAIGDRLGIALEAREAGEPAPMPATTPLGLADRAGYQTVSGTLDLVMIPGEYARGTYDVVMEHTSSDPPPGLERLSFTGEFTLDLIAARRDGMIIYKGCEPAELSIVANYPADGEPAVANGRPPVRVRFNRPVDPGTIDSDRFQLTYPDEAGRIVPVPGRFLRARQTAWFIPAEDLQGGVRYTARVKTGDEGVRGLGGSDLPDADGTGWFSWTFATAIDFSARADGKSRQVACNLFQSSRDVPLIRGKAAVARIEAAWPKPEGVHPSAHVDQFDARVVLWDRMGNEVTSVLHRFVRPDLWESRGVSRRKAEHTAQLFDWRPDPAHGDYRVGLKIADVEGKEIYRYYATCPTTHWDLAPVLTIDYFALRMGDWKRSPERLSADLPAMQRLVTEGEEYAMQLFPLAGITSSSSIKVIDLPPGVEFEEDDRAGTVGGRLQDWLASISTADVVVAFGPHSQLRGGSAGRTVRQGRATIVSLVAVSELNFPRYVNAFVHELGHALELDHIPVNRQVTEEQSEHIGAWRERRDSATPVDFVYEGIEGFRLKPDGSGGWNKSSEEGNGEATWLSPLMFPATMNSGDAFISNHHYRQIQHLFEDIGWSRNAN